jgi:Mlc titration factor MtfA (ptsG expression regulator)
MLLSWLARRRRARILAGPFPNEWNGYLERNVPLYAQLNDRERADLRDCIRILVAEKHWDGCGGLVMTDEIEVTVAAQASILLLGIEHDYFARVMSILVYPTGFRSPEGWRRPDGVVDLSVGALGQAWYDGPVVLAWDSVLEGGRDPRDGLNVVLHEFAHQLDFLDGVIDGTPPLRRKGDYKKWQEVMTREFERLGEEAGHGNPKVLDAYGATDHAEFFAVATEAFFEKPRELCTRHPELYSVLSDYYGQDPAARSRGEAGLPSSPTLDGRKPLRSSRKAVRTEEHASVSRDWPGWVQFWDLHPGMSRAQALRPLNDHATYAIGFLITAILMYFLSLKYWYWTSGWVISLALCVLMIGLGGWLRLAVHWVDQHGSWGGEYRPAARSGDRENPDGAPRG